MEETKQLKLHSNNCEHDPEKHDVIRQGAATPALDLTALDHPPVEWQTTKHSSLSQPQTGSPSESHTPLILMELQKQLNPPNVLNRSSSTNVFHCLMSQEDQEPDMDPNICQRIAVEAGGGRRLWKALK
jgi:hypothetical protein